MLSIREVAHLKSCRNSRCFRCASYKKHNSDMSDRFLIDPLDIQY